MADRQRSQELYKEATVRLSAAKTRLQTIEAAANRSLSQKETDLMLRRLAASQEYFPLALEIASLEQESLLEIGQREVSQPSSAPDESRKR